MDFDIHGAPGTSLLADARGITVHLAPLLLETNIRLEPMMCELVWAPCALQIGCACVALLPTRNSDLHFPEVGAFTSICPSLQALSWCRFILCLWVRRLRDRGETGCPSHTA